MKRTVLAFSGSAASAAAIQWLVAERGAEVVTVTLDVGQGGELTAIREQALALGAVRAHVIDAREEFVRNYLLPALQAGALSNGGALIHPLLAKRSIDVARMESAGSVAHAARGVTRRLLDSSLNALDSSMEIIAVDFTGEALASFPRNHRVRADVSGDPRVEASVWGRTILTGAGDDGAFTLTRDPHECPDEPALVDVEFDGGVPVSTNGVEMSMIEMFESLETIAGAHGVGRSTAGGVAVEAPAAHVLAIAHEALERCALGDDVARFKQQLAGLYSNAISSGRWFTDLREGIDAFARLANVRVNGTVSLVLRAGQCTVARSDVRTHDDGNGLNATGSKAVA